MSAARRTIQKQRYPIQPHDIAIYNSMRLEAIGRHCNWTSVMLSNKKSAALHKVKPVRHAGRYYRKETAGNAILRSRAFLPNRLNVGWGILSRKDE